MPRIAAIPAWTAIACSTASGGSIPRPLPAAIARLPAVARHARPAPRAPSYDWVTGTAAHGPCGRDLRLPGRSARSRAIRLELTPGAGGTHARPIRARRTRRRRADCRWPRLERADPAWRPADIWYPGHMTVRSRAATTRADGRAARAHLDARGRDTTAGRPGGAESPGPPASAGRPREPRATGDTAWVEVAFDARRRAAPTSSPRSRRSRPTARTRGRPSAARRSRARARLGRRSPPTTREAWATPLGDRHRGARATPSSSGWSARCSSTCSRSARRAPRSAFRRWDSPAADTTATSSGTPTPGCSRRSLVTHPDVARSLVAFRGRTLDAARANAQANGYRGAMYPWEADERGEETTPHFAVQNAQLRDPRQRRRRPGAVAVLPRRPATRRGWRDDGYPVIRETADFWVSRARRDSLRDRYHIDNVVSVAEGLIGVTDDAYTNAVARKNLEIADGGEPPARREARSPLGRGGRRSCTCRTTRPASSTAPTRARPTPRSARSRRSSAIRSGSR